MVTPPLVVPPAPALPPVPPTPAVPAVPDVPPAPTAPVPVPTNLVLVVEPPQESIDVAKAMIRQMPAAVRAGTNRLFLFQGKNTNAEAKDTTAKIGRAVCGIGSAPGKTFRGSLGATLEGRLRICTVSVDVALPLIGRKADSGKNVQVTPAGALHARLN